MKKLFLISLSLLLTSMVFSQTEKYVSASSLNVRSTPAIEDNITHKLNQNDKVLQMSVEGAWAYISFKVNNTEHYGYVSAAYLSNKKTSKPKTQPKVLICNSKSSYAYHSHYCHGLNRCKSGVSKVTVPEAKRQGYRPCKICY